MSFSLFHEYGDSNLPNAKAPEHKSYAVHNESNTKIKGENNLRFQFAKFMGRQTKGLCCGPILMTMIITAYLEASTVHYVIVPCRPAGLRCCSTLLQHILLHVTMRVAGPAGRALAVRYREVINQLLSTTRAPLICRQPQPFP